MGLALDIMRAVISEKNPNLKSLNLLFVHARVAALRMAS